MALWTKLSAKLKPVLEDSGKGPANMAHGISTSTLQCPTGKENPVVLWTRTEAAEHHGGAEHSLSLSGPDPYCTISQELSLSEDINFSVSISSFVCYSKTTYFTKLW